MNILLYCNSINTSLRIASNYQSINFTSPIIYRNFIYSFFSETSLYVNDKEYDLSSNCLIISNPLSIDINDKKNLNSLYKLLSMYNNNSFKEAISKIDNHFYEIISMLSNYIDVKLDFEESIDLSKLFSSYQLHFDTEEFKNYLSYLLQYISVNYQLHKYTLTITFGLSNILSPCELREFIQELAYKEIFLLDISLNSNIIENCLLFVDDDMCFI